MMGVDDPAGFVYESLYCFSLGLIGLDTDKMQVNFVTRKTYLTGGVAASAVKVNYELHSPSASIIHQGT